MALHKASRKRGEPTRIERQALERCPECQYRLTGESIGYTREAVALSALQPEDATEHQVIKRRSPHCEKWRSRLERFVAEAGDDHPRFTSGLS